MHGFDTLTALAYLDAHPRIPVAQFVKDFTPIGNILWTDLFYADYVALDPANCLSLTVDGASTLARWRTAMGDQ